MKSITENYALDKSGKIILLELPKNDEVKLILPKACVDAELGVVDLNKLIDLLKTYKKEHSVVTLEYDMKMELLPQFL